MVEYNPEERNFITRVFDELNRRSIEYIVPRGHQELPKRTPGGDIDLFVRASNFDSAVEVCRNQGAEMELNRQGLVRRYGREALKNPLYAARYVLNSPKTLYRELSRGEPEDKNEHVNHFVREKKFHHDGVMIHKMNHIAYRSPMDGSKIRVDPEVEDHLYQHRYKSGNLYVPSPPDELLHLLCRGIFDKDGKFPNHYEDRLETLKQTVLVDEGMDKRFRHLLTMVFFGASDLVYEDLRRGSYDEMREHLLRFSNY